MTVKTFTPDGYSHFEGLNYLLICIIFKLSAAWLQCLPGPNGLSNAAFSEALALTLCMPSPVCKDRVGAKIGKRVVDLYGDNVMSEVLPGDDWRKRHDGVKMIINSLL